MFFPVSGVEVSPFLLAGIGFLVGILGGFFGVGGGFIAGPMMFWSGVPMNFVVGTDLAHMTGKSIVAAKRHRALGHVDIKLGFFMIVGTIIGVEIGARIVEALSNLGGFCDLGDVDDAEDDVDARPKGSLASFRLSYEGAVDVHIGIAESILEDRLVY